MTSNHPLVGRHVRFEGKYRGLEGIVLGIEVDINIVAILLERTSHPSLPAELDGAHPIDFVRLDVQRGDAFFVMPKAERDPKVEVLAQLVRSYFAASREWNAARRRSPNPIDPDPARDAARAKLDTAFFTLQDAIGKGIER